MWLAGLPVEVLPWQVAHEPAATPVWLNTVPANDVVDLWQVSQAALVTMCVAGLPLALVPLWQVAQPDTMPVWFIAVPANEVVDL